MLSVVVRRECSGLCPIPGCSRNKEQLAAQILELALLYNLTGFTQARRPHPGRSAASATPPLMCTLSREEVFR